MSETTSATKLNGKDCRSGIPLQSYGSIPDTVLRHEPKSQQATGAAMRALQRDQIGYAGGINLYEYVGSSPVSGATGSLAHYPGTKSGPIPDGQPTWGWVVPPEVRVPQREKKWYADQTYKQHLGAQSTAGPRPGTSLTLEVIKRAIKRLPPVEEVETWAKAIGSDRSFSHARWLFRLKSTNIVRHYYLYCAATKESTPVVPGKTEVLNLATQWQGQWNGPGAVGGGTPCFRASRTRTWTLVGHYWMP
jgi:hypothetical protein